MGAERGQMLSHYRLVEKIGEGGMGVVWKAEDTVLDRTVAIKVLPADLALDEERRRMFLDEARLAASVSHAHIVQVYELGREGDLDFIVMEYVEGQPLSKLLHGRPLPPDKVADWGLQVAEGLARAHRKGVIHRDLKPANILVTADNEVKIVDFGLALLFERRDSMLGSVASTMTEVLSDDTRTRIAGTLPYMSPEQVRGEKLDARSDIFSFGVVLYEMTTGQRPFTGARPADIAQEILESQPRPVHALVAKVPLDLERIIEKALARRPVDRYQHADDLGVDLRRLGRDLDSGSSPSAEDLRRDDRGGMGTTTWLRWAALALLVAAIAATFAVGLRRGWFAFRASAPKQEVRLRQLTNNPTENWVYTAALSPDGKYLAFQDKTGLFVRSIETADVKQLLSSEEASEQFWVPAWFPDGTKLLVRTGGKSTTSLWVIQILSGTKKKLIEDVWSASVSPDGSRIAVAREAGIWLMGADAEDSHQIVDVGSSRWTILYPAWLPDGKRIAFLKYPTFSDSLPLIESVDLQGQNRVTILSDKGLTSAYGESSVLLVCTSDWRLFYYLNYSGQTRASFWQLALERGTGNPKGEPRKIIEIEGYYAGALSASQDGKRLAFLKELGQHDVYVGEIAADGRLDNPGRLTLDNSGDFPVDWTSDSQSVLFTSNRLGSLGVFKQDLGKDTPEMLPTGSPSSRHGCCLSPDGAWLLIRRERSLLRFRLPSGPSERLVEKLPEGTDGVRCAWGTTTCVLGPETSSGKGLRRITFWLLHPEDGKIEELTTIDTDAEQSDWALSPDGSKIAVVDTKGRIRVLGLPRGELKEIPVEEIRSFQRVAWSVGGDALFVTTLAKKYQLLRVDLQGHVRVLREGTEWLFDPKPSRDGRHLAFGVMNIDYNAWLIEGF